MEDPDNNVDKENRSLEFPDSLLNFDEFFKSLPALKVRSLEVDGNGIDSNIDQQDGESLSDSKGKSEERDNKDDSDHHGEDVSNGPDVERMMEELKADYEAEKEALDKLCGIGCLASPEENDGSCSGVLLKDLLAKLEHEHQVNRELTERLQDYARELDAQKLFCDMQLEGLTNSLKSEFAMEIDRIHEIHTAEMVHTSEAAARLVEVSRVELTSVRNHLMEIKAQGTQFVDVEDAVKQAKQEWDCRSKEQLRVRDELIQKQEQIIKSLQEENDLVEEELFEALEREDELMEERDALAAKKEELHVQLQRIKQDAEDQLARYCLEVTSLNAEVARLNDDREATELLHAFTLQVTQENHIQELVDLSRHWASFLEEEKNNLTSRLREQFEYDMVALKESAMFATLDVFRSTALHLGNLSETLLREKELEFAEERGLYKEALSMFIDRFFETHRTSDDQCPDRVPQSEPFMTKELRENASAIERQLHQGPQTCKVTTLSNDPSSNERDITEMKSIRSPTSAFLPYSSMKVLAEKHNTNQSDNFNKNDCCFRTVESQSKKAIAKKKISTKTEAVNIHYGMTTNSLNVKKARSHISGAIPPPTCSARKRVQSVTHVGRTQFGSVKSTHENDHDATNKLDRRIPPPGAQRKSKIGVYSHIAQMLPHKHEKTAKRQNARLGTSKTLPFNVTTTAATDRAIRHTRTSGIPGSAKLSGPAVSGGQTTSHDSSMSIQRIRHSNVKEEAGNHHRKGDGSKSAKPPQPKFVGVSAQKQTSPTRFQLQNYISVTPTRIPSKSESCKEEMSSTFVENKFNTLFYEWSATKKTEISSSTASPFSTCIGMEQKALDRSVRPLNLQKGATRNLDIDMSCPTPQTQLKPHCLKRDLFCTPQVLHSFSDLISPGEMLLSPQQAEKSIDNAALLIQCAARVMLAKHRSDQMRCAATKIGKTARRYAMRKKFLTTRCAVVKIQRRYRILQSFAQARQVEYATAIQAWMRARVERRKFRSRLNSICFMQSFVRARLAKRNLAHVRFMTLRIQSWYRAHQAKKCFSQAKRATLRLQSNMRGHLARKSICHRRVIRSIQKIQAIRRGRCHREHFRHIQASARILQAFTRGAQVRSIVRAQQLTAIHIQRWWKMSILRRQYLLKRTMAKRLQACLRRRQSITRIRRMRAAIVVIQSRFRSYLAKSDFIRCLTATRKLQAYLRTKLVQCSLAKMRRAALTIQACWRGRACCGFTREMKNSVIAIQSAARRWLARNEAQNRLHSMVMIQTYWRGYTCRRRFSDYRLAIVRIQTLCRRWQTSRFHLIRLHNSATTIQVALRAWLWRRAQRKTRIVRSVLLIQKRWRYRRQILERRATNSHQLSTNSKPGSRNSNSQLRCTNLVIGEESAFENQCGPASISMVFSPLKTRRGTRVLAPLISTDNTANIGNAKMSHTDCGIQKMKVAELREELQSYGMDLKSTRKLRKVELAELLTKLRVSNCNT